jgi:hypothetical protein
VGNKLKEKNTFEVNNRHLAAKLDVNHAKRLCEKSSRVLVKAPVSTASTNIYDRGKSIRQVLSNAMGKSSNGSKRPRVDTTSILAKSTKKLKTVFTASGGVLRIPRK